MMRLVMIKPQLKNFDYCAKREFAIRINKLTRLLIKLYNIRIEFHTAQYRFFHNDKYIKVYIRHYLSKQALSGK